MEWIDERLFDESDAVGTPPYVMQFKYRYTLRLARSSHDPGNPCSLGQPLVLVLV